MKCNRTDRVSNRDRLTVTVNDALAMLGIGRTRLYELINAGEIHTIKLGRRRLVQVASLQRLASEGYDTAAICEARAARDETLSG